MPQAVAPVKICGNAGEAAERLIDSLEAHGEVPFPPERLSGIVSEMRVRIVNGRAEVRR